MTFVLVAKMSLSIGLTGINATNIGGFTLKTYEIVIVWFSIQDKSGQIWFYKETYLLIYITIKIVLEIFFLAVSNPDI